MNGNRRRVSRLSALFVGLTLVAACSDDGFGRQRYSVHGTVTYKGEKLAKGQIAFIPEAQGGQAASGPIENGYYSLTTLTPGDGALPGKYKVTVDAKDIDTEKVRSAAQAKGMPPVAALPQDFSAKARKEAKSKIPTKYNLPTTTDLTADVEARSNTKDFELKD
jgi:type 1 fimbria pilin